MPQATTTDVLVKHSTEAAKSFCESYYRALETRRSTIASFYVEPSPMQGGNTIPTILFNGNSVADGPAVQEIFEKQMPKAKYDVQCVDCHVLNPNYVAPEAVPPSNTQKSFSLVVLASGVCTFGDAQDEEKPFSESFVLVPNPRPGNKRPRGAQEFLIQSQTFRQVA